jgi:hemoglobin
MYDEGRYLNFLANLRYRRWRRWLPSGRQFRLAMLLRIPAGLAILFGVGPRIAAALLAVILLLEYLIYPKFHTCYMFLLATALLAAPSLPALEPVLRATFESGLRAEIAALDQQTGNPVAACLVALTTTALYLFGGLRKCNRFYLSGLTVVGALKTIGSASGDRKHFDSWRPAAFRDMAALDKLVWQPYTVAVMIGVVLLEITLPFGLRFPVNRSTVRGGRRHHACRVPCSHATGPRAIRVGHRIQLRRFRTRGGLMNHDPRPAGRGRLVSRGGRLVHVTTSDEERAEGAHRFYESLGGEQFFTDLCGEFYRLVAADPLLAPLFPDADWPAHSRRLAAHFHRLYALARPDEGWSPHLLRSHTRILISRDHQDRWLHLFRLAGLQVAAPQPLFEDFQTVLGVAARTMTAASRGAAIQRGERFDRQGKPLTRPAPAMDEGQPT